MIRTFCHAPGLCGELDAADKPLGEVILQTLNCWHEDEGPQLFWYVDEDGNHLATAMRGDDPNIAIVTYRDGTSERYNCVYHLTPGGEFDHSTVDPA